MLPICSCIPNSCAQLCCATPEADWWSDYQLNGLTANWPVEAAGRIFSILREETPLTCYQRHLSVRLAPPFELRCSYCNILMTDCLNHEGKGGSGAVFATIFVSLSEDLRTWHFWHQQYIYWDSGTRSFRTWIRNMCKWWLLKHWRFDSGGCSFS